MNERGRHGAKGRTLAINGRFLAQSITGVQRYAEEVTRALAALEREGEWPPFELVAPQGDRREAVDGELAVRSGGRFSGHAWEQIDLPRLVKGQTLLSLGNTAPLALGSRQIVVIHDAGAFDTPQSYSFKFRTWYRALHRGLVRRGARIATVSHFSKARLAANLRVDPERITVVGEGADHILRVAPDEAVLRRHGLVAGRFALAVGSRAAHKNLESLAGAARHLAADGMTLAVVGSIDPAVFSAHAQGIGFPVTELGRIDDRELRALYERAICLLFPSIYEGFGLPAAEALACGCPVLAAGGHAVEEVCADAALIFEPGVADAPERALRALMSTAGLGESLRRRGKERARALTWQSAARDLGHLVERTMAGG